MKLLVTFEVEEKEMKLTFPIDDLDESLESIVGDECEYDYDIVGFEVLEDDFEDLELKYDKIFKTCKTLQELNNKVEEIIDMTINMDSEDLLDVKAVMNLENNDFMDALEKIYNERVYVYRNVYDKADFVQNYVMDIGSWAGVEIPYGSSLWSYLDWEYIAKEVFRYDLSYDEDTNRVINLDY